MKTDMKAYVTGLLETYPMREKQIDLLHYELSHPTSVSPEEMIGAMSLAHGMAGAQPAGYISDKTRYIALNYQDKVIRTNSDVKAEIVGRLVELEQEQNRLKHYVSLLKEREAKVIRLFYFEGYTWEEVSNAENIALRTVYKVKAHAIDQLAAMYEFSGTLN